jgi:CTP:molybdopterin cytidylyltransferase MocA
MFDSFRIGLTILIQSEDWERLVVLPVDHPLVSASTIERLAAARDSAVVPTFGGKHGHPFCVSRRVVESVVCGELSGPTVRDVLRGVGITDIEVNDPGVVANCNTPAALADALSAIRY